MHSNSKELLHLEAEASSLDSKLHFFNGDGRFQSQTLKPDLSNKKPDITSVPKSQVLTKIQDFLSVFSEDTKMLELDAKNNREKYDIQALTGEESEFIEMNLMLGVAELHTQEAVSAAESAIASCQPVINLAASDNETDSEDSNDDDDGDNFNENTSKSHDNGASSVGKELKLTSKSHYDGASFVGKECEPTKKDSSKKAQKRKRQSESRANIVELS